MEELAAQIEVLEKKRRKTLADRKRLSELSEQLVKLKDKQPRKPPRAQRADDEEEKEEEEESEGAASESDKLVPPKRKKLGNDTPGSDVITITASDRKEAALVKDQVAGVPGVGSYVEAYAALRKVERVLATSATLPVVHLVLLGKADEGMKAALANAPGGTLPTYRAWLRQQMGTMSGQVLAKLLRAHFGAKGLAASDDALLALFNGIPSLLEETDGGVHALRVLAGDINAAFDGDGEAVKRAWRTFVDDALRQQLPHGGRPSAVADYGRLLQLAAQHAFDTGRPIFPSLAPAAVAPAVANAFYGEGGGAPPAAAASWRDAPGAPAAPAPRRGPWGPGGGGGPARPARGPPVGTPGFACSNCGRGNHAWRRCPYPLSARPLGPGDRHADTANASDGKDINEWPRDVRVRYLTETPFGQRNLAPGGRVPLALAGAPAPALN